MPASYTVEELILRCFPKCDVLGDVRVVVSDVADIAAAGPQSVTFFANERYLSELSSSKAGAIIVPKNMRHRMQEHAGRCYIFHDDPTVGFQEVLTFLRGGGVPKLSGFRGIHATAIVHPTAVIGENVDVGPYAVIDEDVVVGANSQILAHVYIGRGASIGSEVVLHAHAVLREECVVGNRVIVQPGAVIGSCGFGYSTDAKGWHTKLHHWGNVVLEDDVEIGANTTVDRGRFQATKIGRGTKVDNLVQIAHNVIVGKQCFLVAQVGIAGSTKIGNHVILAGKVAVNGHIEICDSVMVAACSGVSKSLTEPGKYSGIPVQKLEEYNRNAVFLRKVGDLFSRVKVLEQKLEK